MAHYYNLFYGQIRWIKHKWHNTCTQMNKNEQRNMNMKSLLNWNENELQSLLDMDMDIGTSLVDKRLILSNFHYLNEQ